MGTTSGFVVLNLRFHFRSYTEDQLFGTSRTDVYETKLFNG